MLQGLELSTSWRFGTFLSDSLRKEKLFLLEPCLTPAVRSIMELMEARFGQLIPQPMTSFVSLEALEVVKIRVHTAMYYMANLHGWKGFLVRSPVLFRYMRSLIPLDAISLAAVLAQLIIDGNLYIYTNAVLVGCPAHLDTRYVRELNGPIDATIDMETKPEYMEKFDEVKETTWSPQYVDIARKRCELFEAERDYTDRQEALKRLKGKAEATTGAQTAKRDASGTKVEVAQTEDIKKAEEQMLAEYKNIQQLKTDIEVLIASSKRGSE